MASEVEYTACDCLFVSKNGKPATDPNDEFLSYVRNTSKSIYCFSVSKHERDKESEPVVFFDYEARQWRSGRYIGNVEYHIGRKKYSLTIEPRFCENILLEMFGEIFNLKLSGGKSSLKSNRSSLYIKMLVSFIWSQKLAEANRHGFPRNRTTINTQGYSVKGKLMIKPSIFSYGRNRTIISQSQEMTYRGIDVDRADFFQIHTYISYMQHLGTVKFAGLLYPVEKDFGLLNTSTSLYNLRDTCKFIADGPVISKDNIDKEHFFEVIKKGIM